MLSIQQPLICVLQFSGGKKREEDVIFLKNLVDTGQLIQQHTRV